MYSAQSVKLAIVVARLFHHTLRDAVCVHRTTLAKIARVKEIDDHEIMDNLKHWLMQDHQIQLSKIDQHTFVLIHTDMFKCHPFMLADGTIQTQQKKILKRTTQDERIAMGPRSKEFHANRNRKRKQLDKDVLKEVPAPPPVKVRQEKGELPWIPLGDRGDD